MISLSYISPLSCQNFQLRCASTYYICRKKCPKSTHSPVLRPTTRLPLALRRADDGVFDRMHSVYPYPLPLHCLSPYRGPSEASILLVITFEAHYRSFVIVTQISCSLMKPPGTADLRIRGFGTRRIIAESKGCVVYSVGPFIGCPSLFIQR